jgi:hypothetical protein
MAYGIDLYFSQGYLSVASFAAFDMLRRISSLEPEFLLNGDLALFGEKLGIHLPVTIQEIPEWERKYLSIVAITLDMKIAYNRKKA